MTQTTLPDDSQNLGVLRGAKSIGAYIGLNPRQAVYLLEKGDIPAKKMGGRWISTKNKLRRLVEGDA